MKKINIILVLAILLAGSVVAFQLQTVYNPFTGKLDYIITEIDPYWSANYTAYNDSWSSTYNATYDTWAYNQTTPAINTILGFSYYNLTSFDINNYYLKSNPFSFYNVTSFPDNYLLNTGDTATGDYNFDSNTLFVDASTSRVGIGTTSPGAKLDVLSNLRVTEPSSINKYVVITPYSDETIYIDAHGNSINSGDFQFRTNDGMSNVLRLTATGNVGIGTTSPNEALTLGADGVLSIDERAAAPSATAAHGKLWVKNTVPTELWFTDDAGTSTKIV